MILKVFQSFSDFSDSSGIIEFFRRSQEIYYFLHILEPTIRCYAYNSNVKMPWYEAESDCTKKGGHLVVISSAAENDVVYGIVGGENRKTWIGLSNYAQVGGFETKGSIFSFYYNFKKIRKSFNTRLTTLCNGQHQNRTISRLDHTKTGWPR